MFKLWRKCYRAKETADRKASFEFQGKSDLKKGKTLGRFQKNILIPRIMTKFYSLPDRKKRYWYNKKNQSGFRFLSVTPKSEGSKMISTDNYQCGLKSKTQSHFT